MCLCLSVGVDILVEPLRATLQTKVKANSVKQEFEKQDELKRSALRAVAALLSIPDSGECSRDIISRLSLVDNNENWPATKAGSGWGVGGREGKSVARTRSIRSCTRFPYILSLGYSDLCDVRL